MTPLEAKLVQLLLDFEAQMKPIEATGQKWILITEEQSRHQSELRTVPDQGPPWFTLTLERQGK